MLSLRGTIESLFYDRGWSSEKEHDSPIVIFKIRRLTPSDQIEAIGLLRFCVPDVNCVVCREYAVHHTLHYDV